MDETPNKTEAKRNADGTFAIGNPGGPGRPKGKSLKEYWKQRFADMSDEEKEEFSKKVAPDMLWKMAEGNPHQTQDVTSDGEKLTPLLVKFLENDNRDTEGV